jgi:hypothetical protein
MQFIISLILYIRIAKTKMSKKTNRKKIHKHYIEKESMHKKEKLLMIYAFAYFINLNFKL